MQKRSELFFNLILLPIDFLAVVAAFVLAYAYRVKIVAKVVPNNFGIVLFLKIFLLILPVWILIFALTGLYSQSVFRKRLSEWGKIFVAVSGGVMFLILVDFASKQPIFPAKAIPIYGYILSLFIVTFGREVVRALQRSLFNVGIGVQRTLLVGSGELAQRLLKDLQVTKNSGYKILGSVDSARNASKRLKGLAVYQNFSEALEQCGSLDQIIQADSALGQDEILEMINYASNHHVRYQFVPNQFGLYATGSTMTAMAGIPMIEIRQTPLDGWGRIIKRAFDIVGAVFGLIMLSPVFLVVAVLIKLTDPGPVFYKHKRLSKTGRPIYVYKFRSMLFKYSTGPGYSGKTDAEVFAQDFNKPELAEEFKKEQKLVNDPRISRVGKVIRKTSIDELPQLLNVLRGNLSLVGPRPIVEAELEHYGVNSATFLALKPGLTGLWQISGRSDIGYEDRVKLDIYYIENWNMLLDIKILFKTVLSLLRGRGAY